MLRGVHDCAFYCQDNDKAHGSFWLFPFSFTEIKICAENWTVATCTQVFMEQNFKFSRLGSTALQKWFGAYSREVSAGRQQKGQQFRFVDHISKAWLLSGILLCPMSLFLQVTRRPVKLGSKLRGLCIHCASFKKWPSPLRISARPQQRADLA